MTSFNKFSSDLNRDIDSFKLFKRINFKFCPKCNNRVIMDTVYCDNCNFEFKDEKNYFESKYYLNKMIEIISLLEKGYTLEDAANEVDISIDDVKFLLKLGENGSVFHLDFYNLYNKSLSDNLRDYESNNILNNLKINSELYYDIDEFLDETKDFDENLDMDKYKNNLPLLAKWKDENLSFNQIVYNDLVSLCCNLVLYSKSFDEEFYKFMEYCFSLDSKFINNLDKTIIGMFTSTIPLSICVCKEIDEFNHNMELTNKLLSLFKNICNEIMIYCNDNKNNYNHYVEFINKLDSYIKEK